MPELKTDLARLVAIPSISAPNYPEATQPSLLEAYEEVVALCRDAGVRILDPLELPNTAPVVMGEIPAPAGAPTVLLYSHYDVVPVGDESKWESPPFKATERDGAIYGRGAADTKSNILMHVGALRAWDGKPPVGIMVVIEGMEEVGSAFSSFPPSRPDLFAADAMVIGDMGSFRPGVPTLTWRCAGWPLVAITTTYVYSDRRVDVELGGERAPAKLPAEIELSG
jgi:acetylornithine deacetylase/succinyl-diaminopimelate desuccinylase-like protein